MITYTAVAAHNAPWPACATCLGRDNRLAELRHHLGVPGLLDVEVLAALDARELAAAQLVVLVLVHADDARHAQARHLDSHDARLVDELEVLGVGGRGVLRRSGLKIKLGYVTYVCVVI